MNTLIDETMPRQTLCNIADTLAFLQSVTPDEITESGQQGFYLCLEMVRGAVLYIEKTYNLEAQQ